MARRQDGRVVIATIVCAIPVAMIAALLATYLIAPEFYLHHVLELHQRETQIVEIITFGCAASAGVLLLINCARLLRNGMKIFPTAIAIIGIIALASLFFAGEEVSWGQRWFGWETPDDIRRHTVETNLHNTDIPVQSLGSLFLIVVFFALPLAWRNRGNWNLPASWTPAIPDGPVVFSMAIAFVWKAYKDIYKLLYTEEEQDASTFYGEFIDQINEQKEMLVAVSLFIYALYRFSAVTRWRREET